MSRFIQFHTLTSFPPANLNRDDLGRPKTAVFGGTQRLRISSQCIKRGLRLAPDLAAAVEGQPGLRTLVLGERLRDHLVDTHGLDAKRASAIATAIAGHLSPLASKKDSIKSKVITFYTGTEVARAYALAERIAADGKRSKPTDAELESLVDDAVTTADVALFGRFVADKKAPLATVEGALAVAHPLSVHTVDLESDYFTAADDGQDSQTDTGAGHLDETGFAAAVFYGWSAIDWDLLVANLDGDAALAGRVVAGYARALMSVSPSGKKNAFGSVTQPRFLMVERGAYADNLSSAFLAPVAGGDLLGEAVTRLIAHAETLAENYERTVDRRIFNATDPQSAKLSEIVAFAAQAFPDEIPGRSAPCQLAAE